MVQLLSSSPGTSGSGTKMVAPAEKISFNGLWPLSLRIYVVQRRPSYRQRDACIVLLYLTSGYSAEWLALSEITFEWGDSYDAKVRETSKQKYRRSAHKYPPAGLGPSTCHSRSDPRRPYTPRVTESSMVTSLFHYGRLTCLRKSRLTTPRSTSTNGPRCLPKSSSR